MTFAKIVLIGGLLISLALLAKFLWFLIRSIFGVGVGILRFGLLLLLVILIGGLILYFYFKLKTLQFFDIGLS